MSNVNLQANSIDQIFVEDAKTLVDMYINDVSKLDVILTYITCDNVIPFSVLQALFTKDEDLYVHSADEVDPNYMHDVIKHRLRAQYWLKLINNYKLSEKMPFEEYKALCEPFEFGGSNVVRSFDKYAVESLLHKYGIKI